MDAGVAVSAGCRRGARTSQPITPERHVPHDVDPDRHLPVRTAGHQRWRGKGRTRRRTGAQSLELPTLITATPAEGFQLALKLSRLGVSQTQHDKSVLKAGRPEYAKDPEQLIQASQTVAINFQTVAQANNYWRDK